MGVTGADIVMEQAENLFAAAKVAAQGPEEFERVFGGHLAGPEALAQEISDMAWKLDALGPLSEGMEAQRAELLARGARLTEALKPEKPLTDVQQAHIQEVDYAISDIQALTL